jgi:hypothetical protein
MNADVGRLDRDGAAHIPAPVVFMGPGLRFAKPE